MLVPDKLTSTWKLNQPYFPSDALSKSILLRTSTSAEKETNPIEMERSSVVTPELLRHMWQKQMPWDEKEPIHPPAILQQFFGSDGQQSKIAWPALKALSKEGPDAVPDVMGYLPAPDSTDFPELAFGMHILLDQRPRALFADIDRRWVSWFDKVARKFFGALQNLPAHLRPWSRERWADASFEYWLLITWWHHSVLVHSESVHDHELAAAKIEELRLAVEELTGKRDPTRDEKELRSDIYAFPRIISSLDLGSRKTLDEVAFCLFMIFDIHKPIIDKFRRYPYRNAIEGRESSEEELGWVNKTDHFGEASLEVARKVKEDVAAGRWTPLGAGEK